MTTSDLLSKENGKNENPTEKADGSPAEIPGRDEIRKIILSSIAGNRKVFTAYNEFRKKLFIELAPPKNGEVVLHLLPWLLSVNEPGCPGYIEGAVSFEVHGVERDKKIRKRENSFKKRFNVKKAGGLSNRESRRFVIQGVYTIGSSGSVEQNSTSDCDIWICFDGSEFDESTRIQLSQKVNLIRDWMDMNLDMPVYFFVSDAASIRECRFGSVNGQKDDCAQWAVLKEEFYRTCMVVGGKIPLWWLCHDKKKRFDHEDVVSVLRNEDLRGAGVIDLGDIERIEKKDYYEAALWQLHKSLSYPLKSLLKMSLLDALLDAPAGELMCRDFRASVLDTRPPVLYPDPGVFVMIRIAAAHREKGMESSLLFLAECLYLECEINPYSKIHKLKNKLARRFFRKFRISGERQNHLRKFDSWDLGEQLSLGGRLFDLLFRIYTEIRNAGADDLDAGGKKDLTILDRRISVFHPGKDNKVPVLLKPGPLSRTFNLELRLDDGGTWGLFSESDPDAAVVSSGDIIYTIAFAVWNGLFDKDAVQMKFNASNVTLQEIINLATKMENFLGTHATLDLDYSNYLKPEYITRMLVVVGLEKPPWPDEIVDFGVVCMNCWGELFVHRFDSSGAFEDFLVRVGGENENIETSYYIKRSSTSYEKIIQRTMLLLRSSIEARI